MKNLFLSKITLMICLASAVAQAQSAKYELTITNGSLMPLSPALVYTKNGTESAAAVGSTPTAGFIQICQSGNTSTRTSELKSNSSVTFVTQSTGPIMPGESRVVEVDVANFQAQSIHLETMYGKTKDTCGVAAISSHSLVALKQHLISEVIIKDNTVLTDAFVDPTLPRGMTYLDPSICPAAMNAISCVRELAAANTKKAQVRFFAGYSPSLIMALESKFGAADVQTLIFPTSGAIQLKLKLKH